MKTNKNTIQINVLSRHIAMGDEGETNTCAIALAVAEKFGLNMKQVKEDDDFEGGDAVSVTKEYIKVRKTNGFSFDLNWSKVPAVAKAFIRKFDHNKNSAKPFSFRLPFVK